MSRALDSASSAIRDSLVNRRLGHGPCGRGPYQAPSRGTDRGGAGMAKRRGSGEGGIRRRSDGRWEATVDLGRLGRRRRRKYVYGRTRAEVVAKLRKLQATDPTVIGNID